MRLPDRERSRALFVGVGAYRYLENLKGVHAGADALRQALTDPVLGSLELEHCSLLKEGATREDFGQALARAAREAEDLLLLYYAGHGLSGLRRGDLRLTVADTKRDEPTFTGIAYDDVRDIILNSEAKAKVLILDCCYAGRAIPDGVMSPEIDIVTEVDIEGTAILTSVPPNAEARILKGEKYPAYTQRFVSLLTNGIPDKVELLTLPILHQHLRRALKAAGLRPPQANSSVVW